MRACYSAGDGGSSLGDKGVSAGNPAYGDEVLEAFLHLRLQCHGVYFSRPHMPLLGCLRF